MMREHPSRADEELSRACAERGLAVSARVLQSMKERGALPCPDSKVSSYPRDAWRTVEALIRHGWRHKARRATFLAFMDGHPFTPKGVRWSLGGRPPMFPGLSVGSEASEVEIELAREEASDALVKRVISSRNPEQVSLRALLNGLGVVPREAAHDLAELVTGQVPAVEVERYETTKEKWVAESLPWPLKLANLDDSGSPSDFAAEWDVDPQPMAYDILEVFTQWASAPPLGSSWLLETTEDQMARARSDTREVLRTLPHLGGDERFDGIASLFVSTLALIIMQDQEAVESN